jgi:hypothetical protein
MVAKKRPSVSRFERGRVCGGSNDGVVSNGGVVVAKNAPPSRVLSEGGCVVSTEVW